MGGGGRRERGEYLKFNLVNHRKKCRIKAFSPFGSHKLSCDDKRRGTEELRRKFVIFGVKVEGSEES